MGDVFNLTVSRVFQEASRGPNTPTSLKSRLQSRAIDGR